MPESSTPPNPRRFSFMGQLQGRLQDEAERRMNEIDDNALKAVIALVESLQLEVALENIQDYNPVENAKRTGKNEALLMVAEECFVRLMNKQETSPEEGEQ